MTNETQWTDDRIDLIKRTICPKGISTDEFLLFIEQCKRSGLDPLLKQAFCVPRTVKGPVKKNKDGTDMMEQWRNGSWHPVHEMVTRYEFQPAEAGLLARAERFPDYGGISAAEVYAEDAPELDYGRGEVKHVVNPAQRKGALVGAWARVQRRGKVPTLVWVDFAEMVQTNVKKEAVALWASKPVTMIRKCARVAALRTAYPEEFGGLYVDGERPDDVDTGEDVEVPVTVTREKPALPSPAPRETLEVAATRETVAARVGDRESVVVGAAPSREPGEDDGEPDPMEREVADIVARAGEAKTQTDLDALKPRAMALPKGSPEFKTAARVLTEAFGRIYRKGAA